MKTRLVKKGEDSDKNSSKNPKTGDKAPSGGSGPPTDQIGERGE